MEEAGGSVGMTDEMGWPVRMLDGKRMCARPGPGHYGAAEEFRIDGYCSCECRDMHDLEEQITRLKRENAELRERLGALKHERALISADVEPWRTDCSIPLFQMVRNLKNELAALTPAAEAMEALLRRALVELQKCRSRAGDGDDDSLRQGILAIQSALAAAEREETP